MVWDMTNPVPKACLAEISSEIR